MRRHVGGTMLAAALALERGFAINVGGGMHHAYHANGGGWCVGGKDAPCGGVGARWQAREPGVPSCARTKRGCRPGLHVRRCPFDDIMLAVRRLRRASAGRVTKVTVVDLDAHQGNGAPERRGLGVPVGWWVLCTSMPQARGTTHVRRRGARQAQVQGHGLGHCRPLHVAALPGRSRGHGCHRRQGAPGAVSSLPPSSAWLPAHAPGAPGGDVVALPCVPSVRAGARRTRCTSKSWSRRWRRRKACSPTASSSSTTLGEEGSLSRSSWRCAGAHVLTRSGTHPHLCAAGPTSWQATRWGSWPCRPLVWCGETSASGSGRWTGACPWFNCSAGATRVIAPKSSLTPSTTSRGASSCLVRMAEAS